MSRRQSDDSLEGLYPHRAPNTTRRTAASAANIGDYRSHPKVKACAAMLAADPEVAHLAENFSQLIKNPKESEAMKPSEVRR